MHQNLQHFLMGKYRNMEQKKRNRNSQTDSQDPETDTFQDEVESDADTDGFVMKQQEYPQGKRMRMDLHYQYLKESDTYRPGQREQIQRMS